MAIQISVILSFAHDNTMHNFTRHGMTFIYQYHGIQNINIRFISYCSVMQNYLERLLRVILH